MKHLGSIYRRELWSYFRTPIAYVFIAAFNLAAVVNTYFVGSLLETNQADLNPFFSLLPWLFLVLIPGVGMRLWAEEKSSKTLELTLTLPVDLWTWVIGKFLAAWTVIALALSLTFPMVLTLTYLGDPDFGPLLCGYAGGLLMAGAFLAVSTVSSVISKSQVISFVLSLMFNLALLLLGWGVFSDTLLIFLPLAFVDSLASLGVITHYDSLSRGVITLSALAYFALVTMGGLLTSFFLLTQQRSTSAGQRFQTLIRLSSLQQIGLTVLVSSLLFVLSAFIPLRWDLTANSSYSISEPSLAIVKGIDQEVTATLYFSQSLGSTPPFVKQYSKRVAEVLERYAAASDGRLTVKRVDPRPDTKEEDDAIRYGLEGIKVQDGTMYFGVSMVSGSRESTIAFLDPNREDLLEYEIAKALVALKGQKKPVLGIVSGIKLGTKKPDGTMESGALLEQLEQSFTIEEFNLLSYPVPDHIDLLFLVHPRDWDQQTYLAVDQFVMRGGKILMAVDPFSRIELVQKHGVSMLKAGGEMAQFMSQPGPLFKAWGIQFDPTKVIGDPNRATSINIYGQSTLYPLFIKMGAADFGPSPVLKNLQEVLFAEGGSIALEAGSPLTMEPLLQTSEESGTSETFPLSFQDAKKTISIFKPSREKRVLGALFRGTFKSAFANDGAQLKEGKAPSEVIILADVDFMDDRHATRPSNVGSKLVRTPKNDNLNFVVNALEYLAGSGSLMSIRSSGVMARPFTALRDLQKETEIRWREEEKSLQSKIRDAQNQLSSYYQRDSRANRLELRLIDLQTIKKLRQSERDMETKFRRVRLNLREEIQTLYHRIIGYNLAAAPLIVLTFGLVFFTLRNRRSQARQAWSSLYLTVPSLSAGLLFVIGFVYLDRGSVRLNAAPLFENLFDMEDLAGVTQVTLTENGETATLIKSSDGMWRMKESNMEIINTDRLSRLLYDFSEAKIVRKITGIKSSAERLELNKGKSIAFSGSFNLKVTVGKQQGHGGYMVQVEGRDSPYLIDQLLHTNTSPSFWLQSQNTN